MRGTIGLAAWVLVSGGVWGACPALAQSPPANGPRAAEAPAAPQPAEPAGAQAAPAAPPAEAAPSTWGTVRRDFGAFYSRRGLLQLGGGLLVAGAVANSDADQELFDAYHGVDADDPVAEAPRFDDEAGSGAEAVSDFGYAALGGAALGVAFLGLVPEGDQERAGARWVRRSARAYLVGLPAMYYLQQLVGSGRPGEPEGSDWQVFGETHGVSGHAFLGAVPFLTLARQSDNRAVQGAAFVASLAPAWARVDEGKHYPSQALLGWYLAWVATGAISRSDAGVDPRSWAVLPAPAGEDGAALYLHASF